ncbi:MAG: VOC family protein, partial [Halobacteria archaeon]|nr:VOC family protein [Halobacteria archaeon]
MGIATLGHAEILCPNLEETYRHYHDVIGLEEELRGDGKIYMRGWGDWSKYTLVLTESEESGLGHAAFQVEEPGDLDEFARRVEETGREVEWRGAGAEPGHGEAIRFTVPGGHRIELFHEIDRADIPKERKSRLKNQPQKIVDRGVGARR